MKNILIIGYGTVGQNLYNELKSLEPDVYDKYRLAHNTKHSVRYDFAFICVDTPRTELEACNVAAVHDALAENDANIYIIKSTILPQQAKELCSREDKNIIVSPEYYGGTQHCNNFNFNYTVLGGRKSLCLQVQQLLQEIYDARHHFFITTAETAMLAKYMENSWLATKVSFCTQFYEIARQLGVDYEELREIFIADPRVNPAHTFVYNEHPYWDSHCLNKDVPAIAETYAAQFLLDMIKFNDEMKKNH